MNAQRLKYQVPDIENTVVPSLLMITTAMFLIIGVVMMFIMVLWRHMRRKMSIMWPLILGEMLYAVGILLGTADEWVSLNTTATIIDGSLSSSFLPPNTKITSNSDWSLIPLIFRRVFNSIFILVGFSRPLFRPETRCFLKRFGTHVGRMAVCFWSSVVNFDVYCTIRYPLRYSTKKYNRLYILIGFLHCIAIFTLFTRFMNRDSSSLPSVTPPDVQAPSSWRKCQLKEPSSFYFYLIETLVTSFYTIVSVVSFFMSVSFLRTGLEGTQRIRFTYLLRLLFFTAWYTIVFITSLPFHILELYFSTGSNISRWFNTLSELSIACRGVGVIVYVFTDREVVTVLRHFGSKCFGFLSTGKASKLMELVDKDVFPSTSIVIPTSAVLLDTKLVTKGSDLKNSRKGTHEPSGESVSVSMLPHVSKITNATNLPRSPSLRSLTDEKISPLVHDREMGETSDNSEQDTDTRVIVPVSALNNAAADMTIQRLSKFNGTAVRLIDDISEVVRKDMMYCVFLGIATTLRNEGKSVVDPKTDFDAVLRYKSLKFNGYDFQFTEYCPAVFSSLRRLSQISNKEFKHSFKSDTVVLDMIRQHFSEAKGGSFFCVTSDNKYIIKTISSNEKKLLLKLLRPLYKHVVKNPNTLINYPFGCYKLHGSGIPFNSQFIAIRNIFDYPKNTILYRYDLKGSYVDRTTKPESNLKKDCDLKDVFHLDDSDYYELKRQLAKDSDFFRKYNIMDYSLLLGVHKRKHDEQDKFIKEKPDEPFHRRFQNGILTWDNKHILYIGIIDILQEYNFSKKMERFLKSTLKGRDKDGISSVPAEQYALRFRKNIMKHFQRSSTMGNES